MTYMAWYISRIALLFTSFTFLLMIGVVGADQDLERARSFVQDHDLDNAAIAYEAFLESGGSNRTTLLEHGKIEAWRGDHARAMELLDLTARISAKTWNTGRIKPACWPGPEDPMLRWPSLQNYFRPTR